MFVYFVYYIKKKSKLIYVIEALVNLGSLKNFIAIGYILKTYKYKILRGNPMLM